MERSEDRQVQGGGPRIQHSHTPAPADEAAECDRLRLVPTLYIDLLERQLPLTHVELVVQ